MIVLPFCTYRTEHPSGVYYLGKGRTHLVVNGTYKGSGVRFKAALKHPGFEWDTWTTHVLEMFETEEAAYAAEALLIPIESLRSPLLLNEQVGGRSGRNQNRSALVRRDRATEKKQRQAIIKARRLLRDERVRSQLRTLRTKLRKTA